MSVHVYGCNHVAIEVDDLGHIVRAEPSRESDRAFLRDVQPAFHARAGVEQEREGNRLRVAGEDGDVLPHTVLEDLELLALVEIARLVALGLGNKEIARRLGVSVTTVRTHLGKIYGKLGTASRVELALLAAHCDSNVM